MMKVKNLFVGISLVCIASTPAFSDGVLPPGFDMQRFMQSRAYAVHGEYLRDTETRRMMPVLIQTMSAVAKRCGREPNLLSRICFLAQSIDETMRCHGVELGCVQAYWQGLDSVTNPNATWKPDLGQRDILIRYWKNHEAFFQMVYINRFKEHFVYDFAADFLSLK
ncbi:MAG TPA: hypothetical protein PLD82_05375 [Spirochaetota bacterium]|nr:hypothetical protein [Spirochaetota bacterium]